MHVAAAVATAETLPLSDGQKLSLLLAARLDPLLSAIARALACVAIEKLWDAPEDVDQSLLAGRLTDEGRLLVLTLLPQPEAKHFPLAVADVLRLARGAGHPCSGIVVEAVSKYEGRSGWRVSWEGDGWEVFSRQSTLPLALANREELVRCAEACGLVAVPEPNPCLLLLNRVEEEIITLPFEEETPVKLDPIEAKGIEILGRMDHSADENLADLRAYYARVLREKNERPIRTEEEVEALLLDE